MSIENIKQKPVVTESPHIRSGNSTRGIMLDVAIALLPAVIAGVIIFGYRAAALTAVCVGVAVLSEWLWCKILKKPSTISDFSAVVTGLLLAMNLPVTLPFWMGAAGSIFAIIIAKQFFGGIGHNFINPALAARAFLLTSWAQQMTKWTQPFQRVAFLNNSDAVTSATPLALLDSFNKGEIASDGLCGYLDLFLGNSGGCIGEVSALALLLGAVYLLARRVISLKIPAGYILTVAAITYAFGGKDGLFTGDALYHVLSGGLILGAFFMATDYVTTPYTPKGQLVFGIGCGILTAVIRLWGGYPEGVSYSILLMNAATPLIDKLTAPKRFGAVKPKKEASGDAK